MAIHLNKLTYVHLGLRMMIHELICCHHLFSLRGTWSTFGYLPIHWQHQRQWLSLSFRKILRFNFIKCLEKQVKIDQISLETQKKDIN